MIGTAAAVPLKLTLAGLNVQVLSSGRFEHAEEESMAEPLNPVADWNMSVVEPDCPGLVTMMVSGDAVIKKVLLTVTCTGVEVEPA